MEYVLGFFTALLGASLVYYVIKLSNRQSYNLKLRSSQSRNHSMLSRYIYPISKVPPRRQSTKHLETIHVKVLMLKDKAYWIKDNSVYSADIINGIVVEESTKVVDIMGMDKVELEEMMFVIEKLTEGQSNDYRGSGDSQF